MTYLSGGLILVGEREQTYEGIPVGMCPGALVRAVEAAMGNPNFMKASRHFKTIPPPFVDAAIERAQEPFARRHEQLKEEQEQVTKVK